MRRKLSRQRSSRDVVLIKLGNLHSGGGKLSRLVCVRHLGLACRPFPSLASYSKLLDEAHCSLLLRGLVYTTIRDGLAAFVCECRASAASVELFPRNWRAVAFLLWASCSELLDVTHCTLLHRRCRLQTNRLCLPPLQQLPKLN